MPSSSKKQHKFMTAIAHSPSFAKKVGVPQSVGKDFTEADKGRKFSKGGNPMATKKLPPFMGKETKAEEAKEMKIKAISPKLYQKGEKAEGVHKMAKGGISSSLKAHAAAPASKAHAGMAKGGGVETKGKTKGSMVKMTRRFAEGGLTDIEQEAADKAAGLEESNKEKPVGFFERMRMGNIDDPKSEAYKRFGAGRGIASRAAKVPVEDAAPVKVEKAPERAMGEDERPAPTGMGAIAQAAPKRPTPAPVARPAARAAAPATSPAPTPSAPAKSIGGSGRSGGVGGAGIDELEEYAASKRKMAEPVVAAPGSGRSTGAGGASAGEEETYKRKKSVDDAMKGPTDEQIDKGMEVAAQMLGGGASLAAIRALAKKLANSGKLAELSKIVRAKFGKKDKPELGYNKPQSEAPYLQELGYTPSKIGNEPLKLGMKKGGDVKKPMKKPVAKYASGGSVSPASRRGDGIATKGKTRGKMC